MLSANPERNRIPSGLQATTTALSIPQQKTYQKSDEYFSNLDDSRDFYKQFTDLLAKNMPAENVSYAHAYGVFDLLNKGSIHNGICQIGSHRSAT